MNILLCSQFFEIFPTCSSWFDLLYTPENIIWVKQVVVVLFECGHLFAMAWQKI
jgi:hypothetical protein